jgi:hypothetical protein
MASRKHTWVAGAASVLLFAGAVQAADPPAQQQSVDELRDTLVNLLQALVDKGLLTREQAQALVKRAQDKAAADAAANAARNAAQAQEEQNAVRVPYVPQIVQDQISQQVAEQIKPAVVAQVVQDAKDQRWGVPGALPDWLSRVRVFGDVQLRAQADLFPSGNSYQTLLDYNVVNAAGGVTNTSNPFIDTTEDRYRLRVRARIGVEGDVSDNVRAVVRLSSGSLTQVAGSESQTLGNYFNRYNVGIDLAYIGIDSAPRGTFAIDSFVGGRVENPFFSPTELVYAHDLTFEGLANTLRLGWGDDQTQQRSHVYLTLGGFPVMEVPVQESESKWLIGGQLGTNLGFNDDDDQLRLAVAYYDFKNVQGVMNPPFSTYYNFTAPTFVQWGNTMFNIANNPSNLTQQLWALASQFRLADVAANYTHTFERYSLALNAEAVRNVGYNLAQVEALSGLTFPSQQNRGYVAELSFGDPVVDHLGLWRVAIGYRYVQADAVVDAWTDADFHEGGTNAYGYYFWTSFGLSKNTWLRLRYLSGTEIIGPRYALDIIQLDLATRF